MRFKIYNQSRMDLLHGSFLRRGGDWGGCIISTIPGSGYNLFRGRQFSCPHVGLQWFTWTSSTSLPTEVSECSTCMFQAFILPLLYETNWKECLIRSKKQRAHRSTTVARPGVSRCVLPGERWPDSTFTVVCSHNTWSSAWFHINWGQRWVNKILFMPE